MSEKDEARDGSKQRRSVSAGRRRSRRRSETRENGKESSPEERGSGDSWNVDRGRSRTRRPSNPASEDNLRRRGYHTLFSSFGKVFHVEKRWKMIRDMGSGAYGVVISAADEISGETVAIKLVTRVFEKVSLAKRALREITLLRHFANHENITGLIDVDAISKDFNEIYLFMEPMEADLHQIIKSGQNLTNEHVQYFVYQILRGMKYVHSASVVHRDLKPGNLLVNADCELKICDFGLSRGFNSGPDEYATHMTEYVATRWYRAPEIMLAFRRYDFSIDVWSIGCIMAELILGKPLFKGKDYVDQLNKILDVLGTPDETVLKRIGSDKAQAYVRSLPHRRTVPFSKIMPSADSQALDLLNKMLAFDPEQRVSVTQALEHPWLSSYHDINDEPDCHVPYTKWHDIEKLETIDDYREALWNEIQEYRREVRSLGIDLLYPSRTSSQQTEPHYVEATADESAAKAGSRPPTPQAEDHETDQTTETGSSTAVEGATEKVSFIESTEDDQEKNSTDTDTVTAKATAIPSPATAPSSILRSGLERRDSLRPPTPANMTHDPVVHYARRSSILQDRHQHQFGAQARSSISPARRYINEEGLPVSSVSPAMRQSLSSSVSPTGAASTQTGTIPFPTTGTSYIVPARSRTASTVGVEYGSGFQGARKLLRTLSTVSIHESLEGHSLAGMGAMGKAIIERRETAADAPPSGMPRDFSMLREEEGEYRTHSGRSSGNPSGTAANSAAPVSAGKKDEKVDNEGKASAPPSPNKAKDPSSGESTPAKKKERRFIIF